jgi:hypothetical protein
MLWLSDKVQRLAVGMVLLGSVGMMLSMLICAADVAWGPISSAGPFGTLEITEAPCCAIVFDALAYTGEARPIRVDPART